MNWLDILERAGWTAAQAFLSALAIGPIFEGDLSVLKTALIASAAAVLSFLKNVVKQKIQGGR